LLELNERDIRMFVLTSSLSLRARARRAAARRAAAARIEGGLVS
jgi:hypothetical protein